MLKKNHRFFFIAVLIGASFTIICIIRFVNREATAMAQSIQEPISPSLSIRLSSSEIHDLSVQALQGDGESAKRLAVSYLVGYGYYEKGNEWYLIGAENNDSGAQYSITHDLRNSKSNLERERGAFWLYIAIMNGDTYAVNYKNEMDENIYLFEKHQEKTENIMINSNNFDLMKIRAMRGNGAVALQLAEFYQRTDNIEMVFWLRIGAQNGNRECMKKYGNYLLNTNDELSKIRGSFWLNKSRNVN